MPQILRSILAVIAGFVTLSFMVILLTLIAVNAMGLKSGPPTPGDMVAKVAYSFFASAAAGFVTALAAGVKPLEHAYVLAGIMLVMGVVSYLHYRGTQPVWYQAMMVVVPPLCAIAGAAVCVRSAKVQARG